MDLFGKALSKRKKQEDPKTSDYTLTKPNGLTLLFFCFWLFLDLWRLQSFHETSFMIQMALGWFRDVCRRSIMLFDSLAFVTGKDRLSCDVLCTISPWPFICWEPLWLAQPN